MGSVINAITHTIPISQFNRGLAGRIFEDIKRDGTKVVIKNNAPEVVIMPTDEYLKQQEELEDLRLLKLAVERLESSSETISWEEVMRKFNVTQQELDSMEDVELE